MKTSVQILVSLLMLQLAAHGQYSRDIIYTQPSFEHIQITLADYNADGNKEVISYRGMLALNPIKQLFFGWQYTGAPPEGANDIVTGDLNNDGFPELLATEGNLTFEETYRAYYYMNNGNSNIAHNPVQPVYLPEIYQEQIATADFDGDGLTDIITTQGYVLDSYYDSFLIKVSRNVNQGQSWGNYILPTTGESISSLVVGDVNGDNLPDVLCRFDVSLLFSGYFVYINASSPGTVLFEPPVTVTAFGFFPEAIADFDGDGLADIAGYQSSSFQNIHNFHWRKNLGSAIFSDSPNIIYQLPSGILTSRNLRVADLDNDGDYDVVVSTRISDVFTSTSQNNVSILNNTFNGSFELLAEFPMTTVVSDLEVGDVTADGFDDIVISTPLNVQLLRLESTCVVAPIQSNFYSADYGDDGVNITWVPFVGAKSCNYQIGQYPTIMISGLLTGDDIDQVFIPYDLFTPGLTYFHFRARCSCNEDGTNLGGAGPGFLLLQNPAIGMMSAQRFSLWPNPGQGVISVKAEVSEFTVRIFDLSGRLVYSAYSPSELFRIEEGVLMQGVYLVQLTGEDFFGSQKLIVTD